MIAQVTPLICPSCPSATLEGLTSEGETLELALGPVGKVPARFCGGIVNLAWSKGNLYVYAELRDEDVFTTATADQQRLWELGDTFEVFIRDLAEERYFEFHIAPTGHTLQLAFPDEHRRGLPIEPFIVTKKLFTSTVQVHEGFWQVSLCIPWPARRKLPGRNALVSFSRYDRSSVGGEPVLSSTSAHAEVDFHRQQEWAYIVFGA